MKKSRKALWVFFLFTLVLMCDASSAEMDALLKLQGEGLWKELHEAAAKMLDGMGADDVRAGTVWNKLVEGLEYSNDIQRFDGCFERFALGKFSGNVAFWASADWSNVSRRGVLMNNVFKRGFNRGNAGRRVSCFERDRWQVLSRMSALVGAAEGAAWSIQPPVGASAEEPGLPDTAGMSIRDLFYFKLAKVILAGRDSGSSFKLQSLTDLTNVPDYDSAEGHISSICRPPVTVDGVPVFYSLPSAWSSAANDGERLRFAVERAMRSKNTSALLLWADFLRGQFDVLAMDSGLRQEYGMTAVMREYLYALKEDETIAELVSGTQKITLPPGFNYIAMYRAAGAYDRLGEIYCGRMQFETAAEAFEKAGRRDCVDQLRGSWGTADGLSVMLAGTDVAIPYRYRNARHAVLRFYPVDMVKALSRVIESALQKESHRRRDLSRIVDDIERWRKAGVVSEVPVRVLEEELSPLPHHWESTSYIKLGKMPPGAFILEITPDGNAASCTRLLLWIADYALTAHGSTNEGKSRLFLNEPVTGRPVANGKISVCTLYGKGRGGKDAQVMRKDQEFVTDDRGVVEISSETFKPPAGCYLKDRFFMAEVSPGHLTLLEAPHLGNGGGRNASESPRTFMITDKAVYKPGDAIGITGYFRLPSYGGKVRKYDGKTVVLSFCDPQHKEVFTREVPFDAASQSFTYEMTFPADAMLGQWTVSVKSLRGNTSFRVEEYKKPEYLLKVLSPEKPVKSGEPVPVVIEATYYFGAPLVNGDVTYRVFREEAASVSPFVFVWEWLYGVGYGLCQTHWERGDDRYANIGRVLVMNGNGRTDGQGRLSIQIDSSKATAVYGERNFRYSVEAEIHDSTNRVVTGRGSVIAAVRPFEVSIYTPWGFADTGKRQRVQVSAQTADGRTVAGKGVLRIFRRGLTAAGVPGRTGGALVSIPFIPDGADVPEFILNDEGVYELEAEVVSEEGVAVVQTAKIFVVGEKKGVGLFGDYPMSLSTDKPTYQPGDVARILISCDSPGRTVYFLARSEREVALQCITLSGYSTLVEVPVEKDDQPNFFVLAMSYQDGRMLMLRKEICVPPEKKLLNVSVTPASDKVRPGTTLPLKLMVTGVDGKPVAGDMTIAVYDKSLEAVSKSAIPAICPFFWHWKRWENLSFVHNVGQWLMQWWARPGMWSQLENRFAVPFFANESLDGVYMEAADMCLAAGASDNGGRRMQRSAAPLRMEQPAPAPAAKAMTMGANAMTDMAEECALDDADDASVGVFRTNFQDRAFWAGRLSVPETGEVAVEIPVPDNMTTWVVRAWSMTPDTRVGEARTEIVVSKELIARLELPRFMVQGDTVHAVVTVNNTSSVTLEQVRLALSSPELLGADWAQTARVAAHGSASFQVPLMASSVGEFSLRLRAVSGCETDGLELKLPVLVKGVSKQVTTCGRLDGGKPHASFVLDVPDARRPESTGFMLTLSSGAAKSMVELLPYLSAEPSEDVFSHVCRFLPALAAKAALQRLGVTWEVVLPQKTARDPLYGEYMQRYVWKHDAKPSFSAAEIEAVVARSLRNVQEHVNSDGGWGWLGACGEHSWPDTTATVVDALLDVQSGKAAVVNGELVSRGVAWLTAHAGERLSEIKKDGYVCDTDCLVARVLAKAGKPNIELMACCYEHRVKRLSPYGIVMLALAYPASSDESRMLKRNLEQFLKVDDENGTAYLNIPAACRFFWYGNENETLAAYLELLQRDEPTNGLAQKVASYLVTNVRNSPWRNSIRSIGAAVKALARYVSVSGEGKPNFTVTVTVDGERHVYVFNQETQWIGQGPVLYLPAEKLSSGRHHVSMSYSGTGALYWNGMLSYFSLEDRIEPAGLEMRLRRNYYRLVRDEDASALLAGKGGWAIREGVLKYRRVPLTENDVVNPGELVEVELVSTAKNDYDYVVLQDSIPAGFEYVEPVSGWRWSWSAPMYAEFRERGARFYLRNMARGDSNAFYRIRAQLGGRVTALPARGYGLYAPELKCNGAQQVFQTRQP